MLKFDKVKKLRQRRKNLSTMCTIYKYRIRYRHRFLVTINCSDDTLLLEYSFAKKELNLINDLLSLHKILWKQHLGDK